MATEIDRASELFIRGNALFQEGKIEDAKKYFKEATISYPKHIHSWCALVGVLKSQGYLESAISELKEGLKHFPKNPEMHYEMGRMLQQSGRLKDALISYDRVIEIAPNFANAWCNLGLVHQQLGNYIDARNCMLNTLSIQKDSPIFWFNLGNIERDLQNWIESEICYRKAIELAPSFVDGYFNLGNLLSDTGRKDDACKEYERGLNVSHSHVPTLYNWACIRQSMGELISARTVYEQVLSIEPNHSAALHNLGTVLKDLGNLIEAQERYRQALEARPGDASIWSSHLFGLNYVPETDPERSLEEAKKFGVLVASKAKEFQDWEVEPCPTRLRVGLVSGDLGQHPVGYFLEGFVKHVDPSVLELVAFETQYRQDSLNTRLRQSIKTWHSLAGKDDQSAASFIRAQRIHVLLDLSGHTAHNRLPVFAWKPAPVQASWLGYFATTGVAKMDYLIADEYSLPADQEKYFTEKIWRLPETRLCFTEPEERVEVGTLPAKSHGQITLGCFNNLTKMNEAVVSLWSKILHALPHSRLFLKAKQINDTHFKEEVIARYASHGIEAKRLILEGASSRQEYLESYKKIDFALDPFPFPGGTTTAEALWMGVPVLTLQGDSFLSRQGASLLKAAGLPDWVCIKEAEYVEKAVKHAEDLTRLEKVRGQLRAQVLSSPVFNGRRFAGFFASALHDMWKQGAISS